MNRDDLVRDTYAHYGLAMYRAQVLEHVIVNAMVIARMPDRGRITRPQIDAFMDRQFESTLGQLLRELKQHADVPADLSASLREALSKRNWLAHDYFRERAIDFMTELGCQQMIIELEAAQELFRDAERRLEALVRPIRETFGITDEAIAAESIRMVSEESGLDG